MPNRPGFFAELKRRNILRAAALYVGAVWALSQGISQLSGPLGLPNRVTVWFLIACAIAFPLWLGLAWFYEFTPHGFRRDAEIAVDAPIRYSNARKLDFAIIGVLLVAVVLLATGYSIRRSAPARAAAAAFNPPADTLVVLPFTNRDEDPAQHYFSDGMTEELTDALGQNTALRVIAWDTASRYRGSKQGATEIGRTLNVASVLTGEIRRQGNVVRVTVELVNARNGYQVWSNHYDNLLANVFAVQDQITTAIAGALKVKFASLGVARPVNPQAYDLVLKARGIMRAASSAEPFVRARKLLEQAIALDPDYANAHALLSEAWLQLTQYSTLSLQDALPAIRGEANRALALDPRSVDALVALGNADLNSGHAARAKSEYERALEIDPSSADAHMNYGTMLPLKDAVAEEQEAVRLDPDNPTAQSNLLVSYFDLGEYQQALAPDLEELRLAPHSADSALTLAQNYALLHRNGDAVKAFDLVQPDTELGRSLVAAGRLTYRSIVDPTLRAKALATVDALRRRSDLDAQSMGDAMQLLLALGQNDTVLEMLPQSCASSAFGCTDLSVNPLWLPLRGDPRFEALVKRYDTVSKPAPASS